VGLNSKSLSGMVSATARVYVEARSQFFFKFDFMILIFDKTKLVLEFRDGFRNLALFWNRFWIVDKVQNPYPQSTIQNPQSLLILLLKLRWGNLVLLAECTGEISQAVKARAKSDFGYW